MAFPSSRLQIRTEIAPGADLTGDPNLWPWVDISSYTRAAERITITRGRADEFATMQPSRCELVLDNTGGRFVPRNPTGTWYGSLSRNTPLRVSVNPQSFTTITDAFGRTASSGWGTSDSGHAWSTAGGSASDFSVGSGFGKHSTGTTNVNRFTTTGSSIATLDATFVFQTDKLAATAAIDVAFVVGYTGTGDYIHLGATLNTDQSVSTRISQFTGGAESLFSTTTVTGLTHAINTSISMRVRMSPSGKVFVKVWSTASSEPAAFNDWWPLSRTGAVGLKTIRNTGNTSGTTVVSFDNLTVTDGWYPRFTGYVDEFPVKWDPSGRNKYVTVTASGLWRRLSQGAALKSPLYRALSGDSAVVAYWPMEDESGSTSFGSALSGGLPMNYSTVTPASDSNVAGSSPLAVVGSFGYFYAAVPTYATATSWAVRFVMRLPAAPSAETMLMGWDTAGTVARWQLTLTPGSPDLWKLKGYNAAGTEVLADAGVNGGSFYGRAFWVEVNGTQNGGNIDWDFLVTAAAGSGGGGRSGSVAGTIGNVKAIYHTTWPGLTSGGHTAGHVAVGNDTAFAFLGADAANGWTPETTDVRLLRYRDENGLSFKLDYETVSAAIPANLGVQQAAKLTDLLQQMEDAEGGFWFEDPEGVLTMRLRFARYNRTVDLALDYAQRQIMPGLEPADDDQQLRNDVEVTRIGGTKARAISTETNFLPSRIGTYADSVSVNLAYDEDVPQHAGWRMHLGTVDEMRFPQVHLNFAAPNLVAKISSWLGCDIGSRVTVSNPPAELPPDLIDLLLAGYAEVLGPFTWTVALNCAPARPWDVFTVEDSTLGRLDTAGSTLASGVTSSGTSLSVATSTGPLWTTSSGDRPFDIEVAGERMTVTNLTGSSSPQTFTVTRSVNGVSKAQSAGAVVQLWHPGVIAL